MYTNSNNDLSYDSVYRFGQLASTKVLYDWHMPSQKRKI
jgi:hypothetical protein